MRKGDRIFTVKNGKELTYLLAEEIVPGSIFSAIRKDKDQMFATVVELQANGELMVVGRDAKVKNEMAAGDIFASQREHMPKTAMSVIEHYRRKNARLRRLCGVLTAALLGIIVAFFIV